MADSRLDRRSLSSAAFLCAALVLFLLLGRVFIHPASAQTAQPLRGQITNGTSQAPAESVSNLSVTLFQMGASGPLTQTAQTGADGRFAFQDVTLASGSPFFARVDYQGLHYFSDILSSELVASQPLTLTIYETQPLPSGYTIDRAHLILDVSGSALSGLEFIQVHNPTDRAFLLPLPYPANATSLQFQDPRDEFRALRAADGSISYPVLPTTDNILLGVQLAMKPGGTPVTLQTPVGISQLNVLVSQANGTQVSSDQFKPGPVFAPPAESQDPTRQPQTYWQLNATTLPPNSSATFKISITSTLDTQIQARNLIVLGGGALGGLALLLYPIWRRRRLAPAEARLKTMQEIAALDDAFEAGELDAGTYRAERAAMKSELIHDTDTQA